MFKPIDRTVREILYPPDHFQERITNACGKNQYDEPIFRISWAQSEISIQGGEWEAEGETYVGYKEVPALDNLPHWVLMKWCPPGINVNMPFLPPETPSQFYNNNRCPNTGLCLLGEYPYHGSYQLLLPLKDVEFQNGKMLVEYYSLSNELIDVIIPIILAGMEVSIEAKIKFNKEMALKEDADRLQLYEDAYADGVRKATLSAASWLEDKQRKLERDFQMMARQVEALHKYKRIQSNSPIV
jgi:hypothetical protein